MVGLSESPPKHGSVHKTPCMYASKFCRQFIKFVQVLDIENYKILFEGKISESFFLKTPEFCFFFLYSHHPVRNVLVKTWDVFVILAPPKLIGEGDFSEPKSGECFPIRFANGKLIIWRSQANHWPSPNSPGVKSGDESCARPFLPTKGFRFMPCQCRVLPACTRERHTR